MSKDESRVLFREVQAFSFPWPGILLVLGGLASVGLAGGSMVYGMWVQLVLGRPWGREPLPDGLLLLIGPTTMIVSFLPLLLLFARIKVEVRADGVSIDPRWLAPRCVIPRGDILDCVVTPLSGFGFGIRRGRAPGSPGGWKRVTYRLEGSQGVELRLQDGRTVVIASSRARSFVAAVEGVRGPGPKAPPPSTGAARRL